MTEKKDEKDSGSPGGGKKNGNDTPESKAAAKHPWEDDLESYPLQAPEQDPGWAVKTIKIWLWIAVLSGLFMLALIILGFFYD